VQGKPQADWCSRDQLIPAEDRQSLDRKGKETIKHQPKSRGRISLGASPSSTIQARAEDVSRARKEGGTSWKVAGGENRGDDVRERTPSPRTCVGKGWEVNGMGTSIITSYDKKRSKVYLLSFLHLSHCREAEFEKTDRKGTPLWRNTESVNVMERNGTDLAARKRASFLNTGILTEAEPIYEVLS